MESIYMINITENQVRYHKSRKQRKGNSNPIKNGEETSKEKQNNMEKSTVQIKYRDLVLSIKRKQHVIIAVILLLSPSYFLLIDKVFHEAKTF